MTELRKPFLLLAGVFAVLTVALETGSALLTAHADTAGLTTATKGLGMETGGFEDVRGLATPYLALIDVIVIFTLGLYLLSLLLPRSAVGRASGAVTVVGAVLLLILAIGLLIAAVRDLILMVTLFVAAPFGTIVYLIRWGAFPLDDAVLLLRLLIFLKVVVFAMLLLAQPRFLQNKGLVALLATTGLATLAVTLVYGFVPTILVSIVDAAAAVVIAAVAAIWASILALGSLPAVVEAIRASRSSVR
ncbi:hypothetical protein [Cryptosporangium phraense]|uniref:Uncharacterized protein n=1 Tax=Cryptosporangium phraense TaxID=2593070 RepID=A0A545AQ46_9ACTN|nr:hypothetical protein [Cryptosporangium phraense]TQS43390.1 hypothetical protein FL583_19345 [Cryptosporangium phraense]